MRKYPLRISEIVSPEDMAAGRTYVKMPCKDYVQRINNAFFSGFELGSCDTAEEAKSITPDERAELCLVAAKMMDEYFADKPDEGGAQSGG